MPEQSLSNKFLMSFHAAIFGRRISFALGLTDQKAAKPEKPAQAPVKGPVGPSP